VRQVAIAAAVALACLPDISQKKTPDHGLQFKGVPLGATREQFTAAHPEFECTSAARFAPCPRFIISAVPGREHMGPTYGGQLVKSIVAEFDESSMCSVAISLSPAQFDAVADELTKKHGRPQISNAAPVESVGGVKKQQVSMRWRLRDGQIDATKYVGTITDSMILLRTPKRVAEDAAADAQRSSDAQRDL